MNYLLVTPIYNLRISTKINKEITIEHIVLVDKRKLLKSLKRFGFPWNLSELRELIKGKLDAKRKFKDIENYLKAEEGIDTFAIVRVVDNKEENILNGLKRLQEILWILASAQLYVNKRNRIIFFGSPECSKNIWNSYYVVPSQINQSLWQGQFSRKSSISKYCFGKDWQLDKKYHFLPCLIKLLNKSGERSRWVSVLRHAAILAGKSTFSRDIPTAFLFNMIGIEKLLKRRGEEYMEFVPRRINDLLGWMLGKDDTESFSQIQGDIKKLYDLRNKFVHDGDVSEIKVAHLIISDMFLCNLLQNLCRLNKLFPNQEAIIEFGKKLEARRTLGMKLKRPKRLRSGELQYTLKDFKEITQKDSWPK